MVSRALPDLHGLLQLPRKPEEATAGRREPAEEVID